MNALEPSLYGTCRALPVRRRRLMMPPSAAAAARTEAGVTKLMACCAFEMFGGVGWLALPFGTVVGCRWIVDPTHVVEDGAGARPILRLQVLQQREVVQLVASPASELPREHVADRDRVDGPPRSRPVRTVQARGSVPPPRTRRAPWRSPPLRFGMRPRCTRLRPPRSSLRTACTHFGVARSWASISGIV